MALKYRYLRDSERGLSEVVGFVLILGVLVLVFSLYLTYGIPAQGRENEILHMNEVNDQFVSYKLSLDSLFNNNKAGTTLSNSFTLGTGGGYTQGMMSFVPIMSPVSSGGTLAINPVGPDQRITDNETLTINAQSLILNDTNYYTVDYQVGSPVKINYTPGHVYVNISNIPLSYRNKDGVYGWRVNTTSWAAIINLTPQTTFYQNYTSVARGTGCPTSPYGPVLDLGTVAGCLVPNNLFNYTQSDLTISISKNNVSTMQNYPVYRNIQFAQAQPYTIDLMNNAYGLSSVIQPSQTIAVYPFDSTSVISTAAMGNITYNFNERMYTITPIPLGSVEFQAQNNYWIRQNYYYQMGGVFLQQVDGNTTYKLPPEITFSYDPANPKILVVNINALSIDPNVPSNHGIVGGNSPIQLKTTLTNITSLPFVAGTANTRQITIGITTTDNKARSMWKNYFDYTAQVAGIPQSDYVASTPGNNKSITLRGYDPSPTGDYDINVIASNATYMTTVHGVGGIVQ